MYLQKSLRRYHQNAHLPSRGIARVYLQHNVPVVVKMYPHLPSRGIARVYLQRPQYHQV